VWALDSYFFFLHEFVFFEALVLVLVLIGYAEANGSICFEMVDEC
jgi:hypothetical protein